nr:hypothetical protein [Tanacetum cinerariifolium]
RPASAQIFLEILLISLKVVEFELKVIHISVVCCGVGFEFALRNRVLLWRCLKIRVLWWTVLIDSSLVWLTVLIEITALETILVVILLSNETSVTALRGAVGVTREFFISLRDFSNRFMRISSLSSRAAAIC